MNSSNMSMEGYFNLGESILWFIFGLVGWIVAIRFLEYRLLAAVTGVLFIFFGLSDLMEIKTGAWFHPWWLLLWKATCITGFLGMFAWFRKLKNKS
ncbi:MAG: hypothetical protein JW860_09520 [Sedimentisphaerales bacterium]|nr:hypothetical protein [Sedimentisphaerales bacterium]